MPTLVCLLTLWEMKDAMPLIIRYRRRPNFVDPRGLQQRSERGNGTVFGCPSCFPVGMSAGGHIARIFPNCAVYPQNGGPRQRGSLLVSKPTRGENADTKTSSTTTYLRAVTRGGAENADANPEEVSDGQPVLTPAGVGVPGTRATYT